MTGETMYNIAMLLAGVAFIMLVLFIMISRMRGGLPYPICDVGDCVVGIVMPILAVGCLLAAAALLPTAMAKQNAEYYDNVQTHIDSGYSIWINGTEVDISHINLEDYSTNTISIDKETKEIHIAANR